jgi:response regulator RpfG family c-di-GMP phosphodiesterase
MDEKILFIDDDANVLSAYQRILRKEFSIEVATSGQEALTAVMNDGPHAVVVSDMNMPVMNGVQFLSKVREVSPQSVRMMLTGNANQQTAIDAVNEGHIFRFLTKPCPPEKMAQALTAGIQQYRLITAEKELLEKTLKGSVTVLTNVLSLVNPTAFGRGSRITRLASKFGAELKMDRAWQLELAAMLSQLGCVTLPETTLAKIYRGEELSPEEDSMFRAHPTLGAELLRNIPRLEPVAEMIAHQEKRYDGSAHPANSLSGEHIPLGARILKLLGDYDTLCASGMDDAEALEKIRACTGWYDPALAKILERLLAAKDNGNVRYVSLRELSSNMILEQDLKTSTGVLLVAKGQEVTPSMRERLANFARMSHGIQEPIKVSVMVEP